MSRSDTAGLPAYILHRPSGQAVVKLGGRVVYLGQHGSEQSIERYEREVAEWRAGGGLPSRVGPASIKVDELIAGYWQHAEVYYRKEGKPTSELAVLRQAFRGLHRLYGSTQAAEFGPLALKACRERWIANGLARTTINGYVARIRQCFRWAVENELVPSSVFEGLRAVSGLKRGRTLAKEPERVAPVTEAQMRAILPWVAPQVAAMVELQWWTGMRPQEVVQMRVGDLDRAGSVWLYRPGRHKLEHHGIERVIPLGPRAQDVMRQFLKLDPAAALFSPQDAERHRNQNRRAKRKLPLWPSHERRLVESPREGLGPTYSTESYRRAIARGCVAARIEPWSPNQLRHAAATRIRREMGLEAAQAVLGHQLVETTQVYAEINRARAVEAMQSLG